MPVQAIRWEVDNSTALAYVKQQGGIFMRRSISTLSVASGTSRWRISSPRFHSFHGSSTNYSSLRGVLPRDPLLAQSSVVSSVAPSSGGGGSTSSSFSDVDHRSPDRNPPLQPPRPTSRRLAAFRRLRGLKDVDDDVFSLISAAWRDSTNEHYERAWVSLRSSCWPEDFLSIPLL